LTRCRSTSNRTSRRPTRSTALLDAPRLDLAASQRLNARLVPLLANHIGDLDVPVARARACAELRR
jgi:hypothetical protein